MGSGIAQVAAETGHNVILVDQNAEILQNSQKRIQQSLEKVGKKQKADDIPAFVKSVMSKITAREFDSRTSASFDVAEDTDLIVEAIVENLEAKHKLFDILDKCSPEKTIFASNTSSLSINDIFKFTSRQDRVGGLHFFNPVPMMKLVEVIRGEKTSDDTFDKLLTFGQNVKKSVVKVRVLLCCWPNILTWEVFRVVQFTTANKLFGCNSIVSNFPIDLSVHEAVTAQCACALVERVVSGKIPKGCFSSLKVPTFFRQ